MRSALVKSAAILSDAAANFSFSYSSRLKPLTTRIARTFSSMDSFMRSYFLKTARNTGIAFLPIMIRPKASTGTITTKLVASAPPMIYAMTTEKMSISGERTAMRISIINDICTLLTSVVMRVTSEEEENLSIFSKEKPCTRSNIS